MRVESDERELGEFFRPFNRFQKVGVFAAFEFFENSDWARVIGKFLSLYLKSCCDRFVL